MPPRATHPARRISSCSSVRIRSVTPRLLSRVKCAYTVYRGGKSIGGTVTRDPRLPTDRVTLIDRTRYATRPTNPHTKPALSQTATASIRASSSFNRLIFHETFAKPFHTIS